MSAMSELHAAAFTFCRSIRGILRLPQHTRIHVLELHVTPRGTFCAKIDPPPGYPKEVHFFGYLLCDEHIFGTLKFGSYDLVHLLAEINVDLDTQGD